ncbi:MAG: hypothetical protein PHS37_09020, partial [Candidatus Omnitrophica bacterium]|nr:hypothetical protein [Candidatus Omnitrophota bacterium]
MRALIINKGGSRTRAYRHYLKKILSIFILASFLFDSTVGYSLAPDLRTQREAFKKEFQDGCLLLSHAAVNDYIKQAIDNAGGFERLRHRDETLDLPDGRKMDLVIAAIPGLFANRGQFGHLGFGSKDKAHRPIIYVDEKFYYDQRIAEETAAEAPPGGWD